MKITHIDLFSGIGGAALAVEAVWPDAEHIFCEIDPYCQALLHKRFPNSQIHGDIRQLTPDSTSGRWNGGRGNNSETNEGRMASHSQERSGQGCESKRCNQIDILTGGFPCQPFSQAGRRKGTSDNRFLWPEMLRVIREFKPRWIVGENVAGLLSIEQGMVFKQIIADLEAEGYEIENFVIPAVAVNAPHRRDRVWIVANSKISDARQPGFDGSRRKGKTSPQDGFGLRNELSGSDKNASNARRIRQAKQKQQATRNEQYSWSRNWVEVATELCGVDDGLPAELDGLKLSKSRHRADRLKGLGNAWVPQVAIEIFKAIDAVEHDTD
jgi:DNA (cytosine-5)-methyltransferase 1